MALVGLRHLQLLPGRSQCRLGRFNLGLRGAILGRRIVEFLLRDQTRTPRLSYVADEGTKRAYTKEIAAGLPDTEAKIAEYQRQFPDAGIVGHGTGDTQKFSAPLPTLASVGPR